MVLKLEQQNSELAQKFYNQMLKTNFHAQVQQHKIDFQAVGGFRIRFHSSAANQKLYTISFK